MARLNILLLTLLTLFVPLLEARTLCIFSLAGSHGEPYISMRDFARAAARWGVSLRLEAISNERVVAEYLKAGQCDGALLTGIRARQFNSFTGSLDAIGGLPDYTSLHTLIALLTREPLAAEQRQGPYEVAGVLPAGAAYMFLNDRGISGVEQMAGRRLAVLEHDPAQLMMAQRIGVQAVAADLSNFASLFNNGHVDAIAAPAVAYMPLELFRGVGARGLVLDLPVAQLTLQLVLRHERFPEDFAPQARRYFLELFEHAMREIRQAESELLFFFPPPDTDQDRYQHLLQESRIALTEAGHYHPTMMRLMKRVRCHHAPEQGECSDERE